MTGGGVTEVNYLYVRPRNESREGLACWLRISKLGLGNAQTVQNHVDRSIQLARKLKVVT